MKKLLLITLLALLLMPTFDVQATTQLGQWVIQDLTDTTVDDVVCTRYQINSSSSAWSGGQLQSGVGYRNISEDFPTPFQAELPVGRLYGVKINFYPNNHAVGTIVIEFYEDDDAFALPAVAPDPVGWTIYRGYGTGIETNFIRFIPNESPLDGRYFLAVQSLELTYCEKVPPDGCNNIFYWDDIGWTGGEIFWNESQLAYGKKHASPGTVRLNFPEEVTFQQVEVAWASEDDGGSNTTFTTEDTSKTIAVHNTPYGYNSRPRWTDDFEFDAPTTTEWLDISAPSGANKDRRIIWVKIDTCIDETEQIQRPLAEADEAKFKVWDGFLPDGYPLSGYCAWLVSIGMQTCNILSEVESEAIYRLMMESPEPLKYASSKEPLAPIYNVAAGTVLLKEKIILEDCLYYTTGDIYSNQGNGCIFEIPAYTNPGVLYSQFRRIDPAYNEDLWRVFVLTEDNKLITYILTDPSVNVGDQIKQNCVIGRTIPVSAPTWTQQQLEDLIAGLEQSFGFIIQIVLFFLESPGDTIIGGVTMVGYEDYEPETYLNESVPGTREHNLDRVYMVEYPEPDLACNIDPEYSDCLTINPKFANNGEFWTSLNPARPAIWLNPGVILEPQGGIQLAALPLDPSEEYGASFTAWTETGDSELLISIGQESFNFDIVPGTGRGYTIEPQEMAPTVGSLYDIVLLNSGDSDIYVSFFCLVEGEPNLYPSSCYFKNPGFDLGLLFWDKTFGSEATVEHIYTLPEGLPPWDLGKIRITDGGGVQQHTTLYINDDESPHTYEGFIEYAATETWIGSFYIGQELSLDVTLTAGSTVKEFDFETSIPLDNVSTFDFYADDGTGTLDVTKICLKGPFPGQGGGGEETDPGTCDVPPTFPEGGDVQTVLSWHWNNFRRFFDCQLMPMLMNIFKQIVKAFNFATNQAQFWMYTLYKGITWSGTHLFPWLAGYLSNISPGTIIVNNQECSGFDLICLISGVIDLLQSVVEGFFATLPDLINNIIRPILDFILWVLGSAVNLLFSVLTTLIVLLLQLFTEVVRMLRLGVDLLIQLVMVWNTAPAIPIEGLPSCAGDSTQPLCLVWWIMENTIFAGIGSIIIPLIVSFGWIMLGIWIIRQTRKMVAEVSTTS